MYRNVIQVSKEVSGDKLKSLADVAEQEFNNRAGRVRNVSPNPYQFIFEGNEKEYGCLSLGMLGLWEKKDFVSYVVNWQWIDEEEPEESCNVLEELSISVR